MPPGISPRRLAGTRLSLSLALIFALTPAAAWGAANPAAAGDLSARLAELARPAFSSAPPARQAKALSLAPEGPGSLLRDGNRVLVEVRFEGDAAAGAAGLRAAGAAVVAVSPDFQTVTVAAKPDELSKLSGVPDVAAATEVLTPFTSSSTCPSGAVVSEGEKQLRAGEEPGEAREVFGVDGSGVTVGILSDSFNRATEAADGSGDPIATHKSADVAAGDLPGFANTCKGEHTPVEILDDSESAGKDEGRAMAQIVHDLAPGADLAFATAFTGETAFAENIEELAEPSAEGGLGAKVVVDDVAYPGEPFFQEGPIAVAVKHATDDGATYFSSAGNNSLLDSSGHEIGSWETAEYRNSGSCPPALQAFPELHANACLDFNPAAVQTDKTLGIKVPAGATLTVDLQWNEPWEGVGTDLDAFLLDSTGGLIAASAEANPERPLEFLQWENGSAGQRTVQLVVNRFSGDLPRLKVAFLENGAGAKEKQWGLEYPQSSGAEVGDPATDVVGPTVFGHNGAAAAITVGAVHRPPTAVAEPYTSRGPVTNYFGPVEGSEPALPISPEKLAKPEIAATDCGKTSFFAFFESPVWRFCGTSAAAPHAAAVAALMDEAKEEEPPNEPAEPDEIRAALLSSAVDVSEEDDECEVGKGLVEAVGAIDDLLTPPSPVEPACKAPLAKVTFANAQATGDWGAESPPAPPTPPSGETIQPPSPPEPETDTTPPTTFFHRHPKRVIRTRARTATATFELGSNEAGTSFFCQVDTGATKRCPALFTRRYRIGPHAVHVWARDPTGNTDQSAAVFHFRVKRVGA